MLYRVLVLLPFARINDAANVESNSVTSDFLSQEGRILFQNCVTDGGYDPDKACMGECRSYEDNPPFIGANNPPLDPNSNDTSTWCSTVENYDSRRRGTRKNWGFCFCTPTEEPTLNPSAAPTEWVAEELFYADGGGVEEPTPCVFGGRVRLDSGEYTFSTGGCEAVTESGPFQDFPLLNASDETTDTTHWCPTVDSYNGRTDANPPSKRYNWGYCLKKYSTREPSMSPVAPTLSPSAFPSPQPTDTPSMSPTEWKSVVTYLADGAGASDGLEPCVFPFLYKPTNTLFTECADLTLYPPFMGNGGAFPEPPSMNQTNQSAWCAITNDIYNPTPRVNLERRKFWGYCYAEDSTRQPTMTPTLSPIITEEPTLSPTQWEPEVSLVAVGGGVPVSTEGNGTTGCFMPFRIKGVTDESGDEVLFSSCISTDLFMPYMEEDNIWGKPVPPGNVSNEFESVNTSFWCPIQQERYNRAPRNDVRNRYLWGYCMEKLSTRSPTMSTLAPTLSPEKSPTASPNRAPTRSPTTKQPTPSPTKNQPPSSLVTEAPTQGQDTDSPAPIPSVSPSGAPIEDDEYEYYEYDDQDRQTGTPTSEATGLFLISNSIVLFTIGIAIAL